MLDLIISLMGFSNLAKKFNATFLFEPWLLDGAIVLGHPVDQLVSVHEK